MQSFEVTNSDVEETMSLYDTIMNRILPRALMMGIDYDLFWTLNPKSMSPFIEAFNLRVEHEDAMAWSQGRYIMIGIASLLDKKCSYPEYPLMHKLPKKIEKSEEELAEERKETMLLKFKRQMAIHNSGKGS